MIARSAAHQIKKITCWRCLSGFSHGPDPKRTHAARWRNDWLRREPRYRSGRGGGVTDWLVSNRPSLTVYCARGAPLPRAKEPRTAIMVSIPSEIGESRLKALQYDARMA